MPSKKAPDKDPWIYNFSTFVDSSDDDDESLEGSQIKSSTDRELAKEMDLGSREDAAVFKPTPWTIAKLNAASRPRISPARVAGNAAAVPKPVERRTAPMPFKPSSPRPRATTSRSKGEPQQLPPPISREVDALGGVSVQRTSSPPTLSSALLKSRLKQASYADISFSSEQPKPVAAYTSAPRRLLAPSRESGTPKIPYLDIRTRVEEPPSRRPPSPIPLRVQPPPAKRKETRPEAPFRIKESPTVPPGIEIKTTTKAAFKSIPNLPRTIISQSSKKSRIQEELAEEPRHTQPRSPVVSRISDTTLFGEESFPSSEATAIGSSPLGKRVHKLSNHRPAPVPALPPKPVYVDRARLASLPAFKKPIKLPPKTRDEAKPLHEGEVEYPTLFAPKPLEPTFTKTRLKSTPYSRFRSPRLSDADISTVRKTVHEAPSRRKITVYHPPPRPDRVDTDKEEERPLKLVRAGRNNIDEARLERLLASSAAPQIIVRSSSPSLPPASPKPKLRHSPRRRNRIQLHDKPSLARGLSRSSPIPGIHEPSSPTVLSLAPPRDREELANTYAEKRRILEEVKSHIPIATQLSPSPSPSPPLSNNVTTPTPTLSPIGVSLHALMTALTLSVPERRAKLAMR